MNNITDLLKTGESEQTEFKPSLSQQDNITATITAFSNTNGGVLIIGVSDRDEPLGMDIGKKLLKFWQTRSSRIPIRPYIPRSVSKRSKINMLWS